MRANEMCSCTVISKIQLFTYKTMGNSFFSSCQTSFYRLPWNNTFPLPNRNFIYGIHQPVCSWIPSALCNFVLTASNLKVEPIGNCHTIVKHIQNHLLRSWPFLQRTKASFSSLKKILVWRFSLLSFSTICPCLLM